MLGPMRLSKLLVKSRNSASERFETARCEISCEPRTRFGRSKQRRRPDSMARPDGRCEQRLTDAVVACGLGLASLGVAYRARAKREDRDSDR
jgi:hypothetical protein